MKILISLLIAMVAGSVLAGSMTETRTGLGSVQRIELSWSTPTNAASGVTATTDPIEGVLRRVVVPLTPVCTGAIYSITLKDPNGVRISSTNMAIIPTNAVFANCPVTLTTDSGSIAAGERIALADKLTLIVTNCGASASGKIVLYVTPE